MRGGGCLSTIAIFIEFLVAKFLTRHWSSRVPIRAQPSMPPAGCYARPSTIPAARRDARSAPQRCGKFEPCLPHASTAAHPMRPGPAIYRGIPAPSAPNDSVSRRSSAAATVISCSSPPGSGPSASLIGPRIGDALTLNSEHLSRACRLYT